MIYKIKIRQKALKFIEKQDKNQKNYRIIYEQNLNEFIILITKAENRGQIYKSI